MALAVIQFIVDGFRYQGGSAYFLTHGHSDHYNGLSPTWNVGQPKTPARAFWLRVLAIIKSFFLIDCKCHTPCPQLGPVYCSTITAKLMRCASLATGEPAVFPPPPRRRPALTHEADHQRILLRMTTARCRFLRHMFGERLAELIHPVALDETISVEGVKARARGLVAPLTPLSAPTGVLDASDAQCCG